MTLEEAIKNPCNILCENTSQRTKVINHLISAGYNCIGDWKQMDLCVTVYEHRQFDVIDAGIKVYPSHIASELLQVDATPASKAMTPIIKPAGGNISVRDINTSHIVVAISHTEFHPVRLVRDTDNNYVWVLMDLHSHLLRMGGFVRYGSIEEAVHKLITHGNKVAVFHKEDWKESLQWLMDNAGGENPKSNTHRND